MTERMPEYFEQANVAKAPELVREVNVVRRWQTGQEALEAIKRGSLSDSFAPKPTLPEPDGLLWEPIEQPTSCIDLSAAA